MARNSVRVRLCSLSLPVRGSMTKSMTSMIRTIMKFLFLNGDAGFLFWLIIILFLSFRKIQISGLPLGS